MVTRFFIGSFAIFAALAEQGVDDSACRRIVDTTSTDVGPNLFEVVMLQKAAGTNRLDMEHLPSQKMPTLPEEESAAGSLHNTQETAKTFKAKATTNFVTVGSKIVERESSTILTAEVNSIDGKKPFWHHLWRELLSFWIVLPLLVLVLVLVILFILAMRGGRKDSRMERQPREQQPDEARQRKSPRSSGKKSPGSEPRWNDIVRRWNDTHNVPPSWQEPRPMPLSWGEPHGMPLQHVEPIHRGMLPPRTRQPLMKSHHDMTWQRDQHLGQWGHPLSTMRSMSADRRPCAPLSMRSLSADARHVPSSRAGPSLQDFMARMDAPPKPYSLPPGRALQPGTSPTQTFTFAGPPGPATSVGPPELAGYTLKNVGPPVISPRIPSTCLPTHLNTSGLLLPGYPMVKTSADLTLKDKWNSFMKPEREKAPADTLVDWMQGSRSASRMRSPASLPTHLSTPGLIFPGSRVVPPSSSFAPPAASFARGPLSPRRGSSPPPSFVV